MSMLRHHSQFSTPVLTAADAATIAREGKRRYWPSAPYPFDEIYNKLFERPQPASALGSTLIRSALTRLASTEVITGGAGPYGPLGVLWIQHALGRRGKVMGLSDATMATLSTSIIVDLAVILFSIDTGCAPELAPKRRWMSMWTPLL
ncbi:hypothetical protein V8E36_005055 [Tilletia maclaganii]